MVEIEVNNNSEAIDGMSSKNGYGINMYIAKYTVIYSLYFDGRIDNTLSERGKIIKEEYITLLEEPDSIYSGHINANNYYEMLDFKCVFESILTYKYTNEDLDNFLKEEFFPIIFSYPCHSGG